MSNNALIICSALPVEGVEASKILSEEIGNNQLANGLARSMMQDMLAEYNPFVEDDYYMIYFYQGDKDKFRTQYKYNINHFIENKSNLNKKAGMLYVHNRTANEYDKQVIIGLNNLFIRKGTIKKTFSLLGENNIVLVPDQNGNCALIATDKFYDFYSDGNFGKNQLAVNDVKNYASGNGLKLYEFDAFLSINNLADIKTLYTKVLSHGRLGWEYMYLSKTFDFIQKNKQGFKLSA